MNKEQVLTKVNDLKSLGREYYLQTQNTVRQNLAKVFDKGLDLAGQTLLQARKAKEAFVAETHRKAEKVPDSEKTNEHFKEFISANSLAEETYDKKVTKDKIKASNTRVSEAASRKRQHSAGISRSH